MVMENITQAWDCYDIVTENNAQVSDYYYNGNQILKTSTETTHNALVSDSFYNGNQILKTSTETAPSTYGVLDLDLLFCHKVTLDSFNLICEVESSPQEKLCHISH